MRLLKSMLASYSYWLEKYFGITSIVWSIAFLGCCCGLFFAVAARLLKELAKRKNRRGRWSFFSLVLIAAVPCTYLMNRLAIMAYTWDSKLHRVMSNFEYIISFGSNKKIFMDALHLAESQSGEGRLFHVAMYLNDTQWDTVKAAAGGGSWYFEKIEKALSEILRIGSCHLSLGVYYQNCLANLPGILILLLAFVVWQSGDRKAEREKKRRKGIAVFLVVLAGIGLLGSLGAYIFLAAMLYSGVFCYCWTDRSIQKIIDGRGNLSPDFQSGLPGLAGRYASARHTVGQACRHRRA